MGRLLILILLSVILVGIGGCVFIDAKNPRYIYEGNSIMIGGDNQPIELVNNPDATDPSYSDLMMFLNTDSTDKNEYLEASYVCADFAEDLHNNAEASGIRAAWVSIDFEGDALGHASNAFETTDMGLVYVDCTGSNQNQDEYLGNQGDGIKSGHTSNPERTSFDSIAYIEIGKLYGIIDIAKAQLPSYSFFEGYSLKWEEYQKLLNDYNDDVLKYNQQIEGKVYYHGSFNLAKMKAWEERIQKKRQTLDEWNEELGYFWSEPLDIVQEVVIYW